jgi:hypothetical protein
MRVNSNLTSHVIIYSLRLCCIADIGFYSILIIFVVFFIVFISLAMYIIQYGTEIMFVVGLIKHKVNWGFQYNPSRQMDAITHGLHWPLTSACLARRSPEFNSRSRHIRNVFIRIASERSGL